MFSSIRSEIRQQFLGFIALVLVVSGGTAYASHELINSSDIADESIQSVDIRNGQVKSADVLDGSVQSADIRNGHVQNADIQRDAITSDRIRDAGISDSDLANDAVSSPKVLDNSLTGDDIFDSTLGSLDIADDSLTRADIATGAVRGVEVDDYSIYNEDLGTNSVDARNVDANSLEGADINEATLGTVPSALLGGTGRAGHTACGILPANGFYRCSNVTLTLPAAARVLLMADIEATTVDSSKRAQGRCDFAPDLGSDLSGPFVSVTRHITIEDSAYFVAKYDSASLTMVTPEFPAGEHSFWVSCSNDTNINYVNTSIIAVGLSAG